METDTTKRARIMVQPQKMGRVTTWTVHCHGCDMKIKTRRKPSAELVARNHASEGHQGRAVVAIAKA